MADDTSTTAFPPALVSDPAAEIGTDEDQHLVDEAVERALGVRKIKPVQTAVLALGLCLLFWAVVVAVVVAVIVDLTVS